MTFAIGSRVEVKSAAGDNRENGAVVRPPVPYGIDGWFAVRFDRGGTMAVHASNLRPAQ